MLFLAVSDILFSLSIHPMLAAVCFGMDVDALFTTRGERSCRDWVVCVPSQAAACSCNSGYNTVSGQCTLFIVSLVYRLQSLSQYYNPCLVDRSRCLYRYRRRIYRFNIYKGSSGWWKWNVHFHFGEYFPDILKRCILVQRRCYRIIKCFHILKYAPFFINVIYFWKL